MSLRMSRKSFAASSLLLTGFCLLAFQNCAPAKFGNTSGGNISTSLGTESVDSGNNGNGAQVPVVNPGTPAVPNPSPSPSPSPTPGGNANVPVVGAGCGALLPITADMNSSQDLYYQNVSNAVSVPSARNLGFLDIKNSVEVGYANTLQNAQNIKGAFTGRFSKVNQLLDISGNVCVAAHSVDRLQNLPGLVTVVGLVEQSKVAQISNILDLRGGLRVKDADIGYIQNTKGTMVLENVNVTEIFDHTGDIYLINSNVANFRNINGQVYNQ